MSSAQVGFRFTTGASYHTFFGLTVGIRVVHDVRTMNKRDRKTLLTTDPASALAARCCGLEGQGGIPPARSEVVERSLTPRWNAGRRLWRHRALQYRGIVWFCVERDIINEGVERIFVFLPDCPLPR